MKIATRVYCGICGKRQRGREGQRCAQPKCGGLLAERIPEPSRPKPEPEPEEARD